MADYSTSGVHLVNRFVLDKLDAAGIMSKAAYRIGTATVSPFIPANMVPELLKLDRPFVVYNYQSVPDSDWWLTPTDQAVYVVYSNDEALLRRIYNFILQLLNRQDITREEVNDYIDALPSNSPFANWEFKSLGIQSAQGPDPYTQEGGIQQATIIARFQYAVPLNNSNYMRL